MLTIYHLGLSQSDRVVWMAEELGIPYQLDWYDRGPDFLAPPEYTALHPTASAPVIADGDLVLTESAAILEYLSHQYGDGKLSVLPDRDGPELYAHYLYWMNFNNNVQAIFFAKNAAGDTWKQGSDKSIIKTMQRREQAYFQYLDQWLESRDYLMGDRFTCADIMVMFNVTTLAKAGGGKVDDLSNIQRYIARVGSRPAYQKAMAIAGPLAKRP